VKAALGLGEVFLFRFFLLVLILDEVGDILFEGILLFFWLSTCLYMSFFSAFDVDSTN
jgi:hypothetical protein